MDVSRDGEHRDGHASRSLLVCRGGGAFGDVTNSAFVGNATFGASASFKLDRALAKTSAERSGRSRAFASASAQATPLASPVAAHPSAGFGTPAGVALVGGVGFGPFDAVPPTPARPRRLDAFDDEDDGPRRGLQKTSLENLENLGFDMSRETMTTCVATWILSPSIDDAEREEFDAIVAQETK